MQNHYYANGKLLLTGEYLVVKGSTAIAFPVKFGQSLVVNKTNEINVLHWQAFSEDTNWLNVKLNVASLITGTLSENKETAFLQNLLKAAHRLNPNFLNTKRGIHSITKTNYRKEWGLGSSSTLISLVSQWAQVDKFELFNLVANGSGYDVACAESNFPILFQRKAKTDFEYNPVKLDDTLYQYMYFGYLGKKQDSQQEVRQFRASGKDYTKQIKQINEINKKILNTASIDLFAELLYTHELIIGEILEREPVQQQQFNDFNGIVKSLGAWGGDFFLAVSTLDESTIRNYFLTRGISVLFPAKKLLHIG